MKRQVALALALALSLGPGTAAARVTSLTLAPAAPFADGASFGAVGRYERVVGVAHGELDPADSRNSGIADVALAPRNARGLVEYATDIFILRPQDPAKGSRTLLYEVLNRGRKFLPNWLLDAPAQAVQAVNDPFSLADAGDALPFKRGDTIVWSGWEADAPRTNGGMAVDVPVATGDSRAGGPSIVATVRDELVSDTRGPLDAPLTLSFAAASLDQGHATLTTRRREADPAVPIPASGWRYLEARQIALLPDGTKPAPGSLYEFTYQAVNPKVQGIGFAATRDLVGALRGDGPLARQALGGQALGGQALGGRSLGGGIAHAVAFGISESGRYLRDFIHGGFNADEDGRNVFDGVLAPISGVGGVFLNARFAQPSRTNTQHEDHLYPEDAFPFSSATLRDPVTSATGAVLRHDGFDPLLIETDTETAYWQKGASLLATDPLGTRDVDLPATTRAFLIASGFHHGRGGLTDARPCANPRNTLNPAPMLRALLVDLEEWVVADTPPPASRLPSLADGTLVAPDATSFPAVPGFEVAHRANAPMRLEDTVHGRVASGQPYRVLVPKVDAVGNDLAGVRPPEVAVPRATRTDWISTRCPSRPANSATAMAACWHWPPPTRRRMMRGPRRPPCIRPRATTLPSSRRRSTTCLRPACCYGRRGAAVVTAMRAPSSLTVRRSAGPSNIMEHLPQAA